MGGGEECCTSEGRSERELKERSRVIKFVSLPIKGDSMPNSPLLDNRSSVNVVRVLISSGNWRNWLLRRLSFLMKGKVMAEKVGESSVSLLSLRSRHRMNLPISLSFWVKVSTPTFLILALDSINVLTSISNFSLRKSATRSYPSFSVSFSFSPSASFSRSLIVGRSLGHDCMKLSMSRLQYATSPLSTSSSSLFNVSVILARNRAASFLVGKRRVNL